MSLHSILDWIDEVSGSEYIWFVKYLSGNDTGANNTHQAGPYIPNTVAFGLFFPNLRTRVQRIPMNCWTRISTLTLMPEK